MEYRHDQAEDTALWVYFETWYLITLGTDRLSHVVYNPDAGKAIGKLSSLLRNPTNPVTQTVLTNLIK